MNSELVESSARATLLGIVIYLLIGVAWGLYSEWKFRAVAREATADPLEFAERHDIPVDKVDDFLERARERDWVDSRRTDLVLWPYMLGAYLWFMATAKPEDL